MESSCGRQEGAAFLSTAGTQSSTEESPQTTAMPQAEQSQSSEECVRRPHPSTVVLVPAQESHRVSTVEREGLTCRYMAPLLLVGEFLLGESPQDW